MTDFSTVEPGEALRFDHSDVLPTRAQNPARASAGETETVVGVVLAGGQGTRFSPLTRKHAKPAVPFGARHCIIDYALPNLVNSGVRSIYVLLQHHLRSVRNHLRTVRHTVPGNGFVQPLQGIERPFRGTADAVRQSIDRLQVSSADAVLVFGADHVYRMDVREMIDFHRRRLADRSWPIRVPGRSWPSARLLRAPLHAAQIDPGARVRDARIASAVIRRAAKVEEGPGLEQCVVLDGARIEYGARLHRVNVNQNAPIPAHARIGFDSAPDSRNHFITPSGITVVTNQS